MHYTVIDISAALALASLGLLGNAYHGDSSAGRESARACTCTVISMHQPGMVTRRADRMWHWVSIFSTLLLLLFASTKFCDLGIPTILRVHEVELNFAILRKFGFSSTGQMTRKRKK